MSVRTHAPAAATALAHIEAWSNHDWETARKLLAPGVRVTATTSQPIMPPVDLTGVEDYMTGLVQFAGAVTPGSAHIESAIGDDHNALITLTVSADLGDGSVDLPGARLYRIDADGRIETEHVVFFALGA